MVPDSSFEVMMSCPTTFGMIYCPLSPPGWPQTLTHWFSAVPNSPDYYHSCSTDPTSTQPINFYGDYPPRTGQGYAGLVAYGGLLANGPTASYREYIETQLTQPLVAGQKYTISMWVNFAFHPDAGSFHNVMAVNRLEVHFSTTLFGALSGPLSADFVPVQTQPVSYLTDTSQWVRITGEYTATGGEQFMTIGTFNNGVMPPLQQHAPTTPINGATVQSYYMIDDVSLYPEPIIPCDTLTISQDTLVCTLDAITLQPTSTATAYYWSTGATTQHISVNNSGTYWRVATMGCDATIDTFHVQYFNSTTTNNHDTSICAIQQSITLQGHPGASSYLWNNGATTSSTAIQQGGTYICRAIVNCDLYVDTFYVEGFITTTTVKDTTLCFPAIVTLESIPDAGQYQWNTGQTTASISVSSPGTYHCRAYKDCDLYIHEFTITDKAQFKEISLGSDTIICKGNLISIGHEYPGAISYLWNTGSTNCCITPDVSGQYSVAIDNGCTILNDDIYIDAVTCEDCIYMPTAFTPNGDGKNDRLGVVSKCPLHSFNLKIFNRFGELVYDSKDVMGKWNGMYEDERADLGVYFYYIQYTSAADMKDHFIKGDITLIY